MDKLPYDKTNAKSIENYGKKLIGKTFRDIISEDNFESEIESEYGNRKRKGGLGNLLEEVYFHYKCNSDQRPDFPEAGVELKVSNYEIGKNKKLRAGERVVLSMIDYRKPIEQKLEDSHLWEKCKLILLVYYLRNRNIINNILYKIDFVSLFTPPEEDLSIIRKDYEIIANKIIAGKAHELSESDTFYLGACTKGATAATSIVKQFYPPHLPAKKRAFCYKVSYMTIVLNKYIKQGKFDYEPIIKNKKELEYKSFNQAIKDRLKSYIGLSDEEICRKFNLSYTQNKSQWTTLTYRMLGIKNNKAEEFEKAGIVTKVIRIEENGIMRESMSFPTFKYKELASETWENSTLRNYFNETKFFFVVFKKKNDNYYLQGCQFWNMPYVDLENTVREGWQNIVDKLNNGIKLTVKIQKNGKVIVENDLPKACDNPIIHVRPHASKRYFKFKDGTVIGDGAERDANELPDGTIMPNYCFWLNNTYIIKQLNKELLNNS